LGRNASAASPVSGCYGLAMDYFIPGMIALSLVLIVVLVMAGAKVMRRK